MSCFIIRVIAALKVVFVKPLVFPMHSRPSISRVHFSHFHASHSNQNTPAHTHPHTVALAQTGAPRRAALVAGRVVAAPSDARRSVRDALASPGRHPRPEGDRVSAADARLGLARRRHQSVGVKAVGGASYQMKVQSELRALVRVDSHKSVLYFFRLSKFPMSYVVLSFLATSFLNIKILYINARKKLQPRVRPKCVWAQSTRGDAAVGCCIADFIGFGSSARVVWACLDDCFCCCLGCVGCCLGCCFG
jgi:hypothetical protein